MQQVERQTPEAAQENKKIPVLKRFSCSPRTLHAVQLVLRLVAKVAMETRLMVDMHTKSKWSASLSDLFILFI